MGTDLFLIVRILFWGFTAGTLLLPIRWSVLCWLVTAHLDLSGPYWLSASLVGWENTIRIVGLPTILLLRLGVGRTLPAGLRLAPFQLWILFSFYAALTTLWSPAWLPALKQVGYLYAYSVGFLLLLRAWQRGIIESRLLRLNIWSAFLLGIAQTLVLGNLFGTPAGRFTSFISPQVFAQSQAAILPLVLFIPTFPLRQKALYTILILAELIWNGSRVSLFGAAIVLLVASAIHPLSHTRPTSRVISAFSSILCLAVVLFSVNWLVISPVGHHIRAAELVTVARGEKQLYEIGTWRLRRHIWETAINHIAGFGTVECAFGRGTSSAGAIRAAFRGLRLGQVGDQNRVVHCEFLRVFYEWGVVGSTIFLTLVASIFLSSVRCARRGAPAGYATVSVVPMLIAALFTENLLTGSGGAGGISYLLTLSFGVAFSRRTPQNSGLKDSRVDRRDVAQRCGTY